MRSVLEWRGLVVGGVGDGEDVEVGTVVYTGAGSDSWRVCAMWGSSIREIEG